MKLRIFAAALFAACSLGVVAFATSASAIVFLLAEWLLPSEAGVAETLLAETSGELILENKNAPTIKKPAAVNCSGILVGSVGPDGADEIMELLNLTGTLIGKPLEGAGLACTLVAECESSKAWAANLPWLTKAELFEEESTSGFVDLLTSNGAGNPGWYIECTILFVKATEECTTPEGGAELSNVAGEGVLGVFSEAFTQLMGQKLALCSGNNEETGVVRGAGGVTKLTNGEVLAISSQ